MPSYSKNDVILVRYPFSDLTAIKVRPAIVVSEPHPARDSLYGQADSLSANCCNTDSPPN